MAFFSYRNLETISISTCRLHGSPKLGSTNASPHHRMLHQYHLHHPHLSRVQNLDLMDDIPLPFQNDHLGILNQDTPMLSPNPPPSVIDSNPQNLPMGVNGLSNPNSASNVGNQTSLINNINLNSATSTNVIINNIKTNTTSLGKANPESGLVEQLEEMKDTETCNQLRNRWHTCPDLHKAMDGVTYIADHTKKEEESTRVRLFTF